MSVSIIIFLSIIVLIASLIFTKIKYKTIFELNIIYTILWISVMLSSKYNNLGLIEPRTEIYLIIFLTIIIINIIFIFNPFKIKDRKEIDYSNYSINNKRLIILNIIAIILFVPSIISALKIFLTKGFDLVYIRNTIYVGITEAENAAIYSIIFRTIPTSIFFFVELISSYYLIKFKNKKIIVLGLIDVIIGTLIFGGRNFILNYGLFFLFHYINLPRNNRLKIKKRYFIYIIILLFIITKNRDVSNISFIQTIILYFAGSLSFFELIMSHPYIYGLNVKHYGLITFGFITEPIILFLKTFFKMKLKVPSYYFNIYAQRFVNIGQSRTLLYNNNSTFLYPFALDFGIKGILLGPLFYFIIIYYVLLKKNKGNLVYYFIYIYLATTIVTSSVSYGLIGLTSSIMMLLIILTIKKDKIEKGDM